MSELINNRRHRIDTLKRVIRHLHAGRDPAEVREELKQMVSEVESGEIAAMEQELMAEGMAAEEVQSMCDLHSNVLREVLVERLETPEPAGHPLDTFKRENEALAKVVAAMREAMGRLGEGTAPPPAELIQTWRRAFNDLNDIEKHYRRKENLLFSMLERHDLTGPSKVMWGKDDEVRGLLQALGQALGEDHGPARAWSRVAMNVADPALNAVEEMIFKETKILFPLAKSTLTEDEWGEIWSQSPEYGWCLVEPGEAYRPPETAAPRKAAQLGEGEALVFPTGSLAGEQLRGLLKVLPVDVTFVDADDRVAYFSEGPDRVFDRSKAILGRKVQHCHPPGSVATVERIVADFRSAARDVAEFWIELHGKFIHIRYFAVRDEKGTYLGTLEVTQDLTRLRALQGERRLLAYDEPGPPACPPVPAREAPDESRPAWVANAEVAHVVDGDAMLARGIHPLQHVDELCQGLPAGAAQAVRLDSSFVPAPLIDFMRAKGRLVYTEPDGEGMFATYIAAP